MSSRVPYVVFVDGVEFKVWSDDPIAKVVRAWCSRMGLDTSTTVLTIPRIMKVVSVLDKSKVADMCVEGDRLVSIGCEPRREASRFEVWVRDRNGGKVLFVGTPKTLIRQLVTAACQRNCVSIVGAVASVERTGELLTILDDRRWDQALVEGDVVAL